MKKLLVFITLVVAIGFLPLHSALCEDVTTGETGSGSSIDTREIEAAETEETGAGKAPAAAMSAAGAGDANVGAVGKAQLLSPLLSESFQTDLATGAATVSVPIVVPPGRKNMQPSLALSYSSNNSNGICGVGWGLTTSSVQRSTKRGTPKYDNTDTFIFSSSGSTGELIPIDAANTEYRQKIETAFMKYIYDNATSKWTVYDKNGTKYTFGSTAASQIVDPSDSTKVFSWFLDSVEGIHGNRVTYTYIQDGSQVYLSTVDYTDNISQGLSADKTIELIYDETGRPDIIYNNRSGWEIATNWLLKEIQIKVDNNLKWKYLLTYNQSIDTDRSLLSQVQLEDSGGNSLPPKTFTYQTIEETKL